MSLVAVPNVAEGRDRARVAALRRALQMDGARVLDVHTDAAHNRSVLTATGAAGELIAGAAELARAASYIDLRSHTGVHPRLGGLDVFPFVPIGEDMDAAVDAARAAARSIAAAAGVPVYLYGEAATRAAARDLPRLRAGGLAGIAARARAGLVPDEGPRDIDPRRGVVCVGARPILVAFNVWLRCDPAAAAVIAGAVRGSAGGLPGVRALGLDLGEGLSQVSMNLTAPHVTGIDRTFDEVARLAGARGIEVVATEIVGLAPQRFLPDPSKRAARLLREPGRSLESALGA